LDCFEKRLRHLDISLMGEVDEVHEFIGVAIEVRMGVHEANLRVLVSELLYEQRMGVIGREQSVD